jgi:hypothetical protein
MLRSKCEELEALKGNPGGIGITSFAAKPQTLRHEGLCLSLRGFSREDLRARPFGEADAYLGAVPDHPSSIPSSASRRACIRAPGVHRA